MPSSVDVFIENSRVFSTQIEDGPFRLEDVPVHGGGDAEIVVRGIDGQTTRRTVSFFSSDGLLKKGMADYSLALGRAREGFGFVSNEYGEDTVFTANLRYGLSKKITVDAHYSATDELQLAGVGMTAVPLSLGEVRVALATSDFMGRQGNFAQIDLQTEIGGIDIRTSSTRTDPGFADLAFATGLDYLSANGGTEGSLLEVPLAQDVVSLSIPVTKSRRRVGLCYVSDIDFGAVSLRAGEVNRTSGTLTVTCSNVVDVAIGVCVRFGPGSGGAGSGNSPRYMTGPTGQSLAYQLRQGGHGAVFGTLNEVYLFMPVVLGQAQSTIPIYAEILSNGTEFDTGAYASDFAGQSHIEMSHGIASCSLFGQSNPVADFRVSAQTVASCELDVSAMNFGQINNLHAAPADAVAAVDIRCTSGASYSVSLGLGEGSGVTDPAFRKMHSSFFLH